MSRFILIGSCLSLLVMVNGCEIREPVLPSWETVIQLPFAPEIFVMGERIVDSDGIATIGIKDTDPDSVLFVSIPGDIAPLEISQADLSVKLDDARETMQIDTLKLVNLPVLKSPFIGMETLFPTIPLSPGETTTIPAATFNPPAIPLSSPDFVAIHVLQGTIRMRIFNRLPVTIGPNAETPGGMEVTLINQGSNNAFATLKFPQVIQPGEQAEALTVIADRQLRSPLRLEYRLPIAQSRDVLVTPALLDTAGIRIELQLENIMADEAFAVLEPQQFRKVVGVRWEEEDQLRSATIASGRIVLDFSSFLDVASEITYTIPLIHSAGGDPFQDAFFLEANGTARRVLVLDHLDVGDPGHPGNPIDEFEILVQARTLLPEAMVQVGPRDSVTVMVSPDTIFFESFSGLLAQQAFIIPPLLEENVADYDGYSGGVELKNAFLNLKVSSAAFIENLEANLELTGLHFSEDGVVTASDSLFLPGLMFNLLPRAGGDYAAEITLSGKELARFLNFLPTAIEVEGVITGSGEAELSRGNQIDLAYLFETPFITRIKDLLPFQADPDTLTDQDIGLDLREALADNRFDADLRMAVLNQTPLGGTARFIITADFSDPDIYDADFDTSRGWVREFEVVPAETDPETGFVKEVLRREVHLELNDREVKLFSNPPLRFGYELKFNDTEEFITLRYQDFVRFLGEVDVRVLVEE